MDIDKIRASYETLSNDLRRALSTMDKSDRVISIKQEITKLQHICPHDNGNYDFSQSDECPYCGKKFKG